MRKNSLAIRSVLNEYSYIDCTYATILALVRSSGNGPSPASMLSATCLALDEAGITPVTAGCAIIYFNRKAPQLCIFQSAAQSGNGRFLNWENKRPWPNGLLI